MIRNKIQQIHNRNIELDSILIITESRILELISWLESSVLKFMINQILEIRLITLAQPPYSCISPCLGSYHSSDRVRREVRRVANILLGAGHWLCWVGCFTLHKHLGSFYICIKQNIFWLCQRPRKLHFLVYFQLVQFLLKCTLRR